MTAPIRHLATGPDGWFENFLLGLPALLVQTGCHTPKRLLCKDGICIVIKLDEIRFKNLDELAVEHFDTCITPTEKGILHDSASSADPPAPGVATPRPTVRAEFLRWLATDPEAAPHIDPKGIRVYGAIIKGRLDLEECTVSRALDFRYCEFTAEISLKYATTQGIYFFASSLAGGIAADQVAIHGHLFLRRIESQGEVRIVGAHVGGNVDCAGAHLRAKDGALIADGANIGGDVFLSIHEDPTLRRFESEGTISLIAADISGQLFCSGAKLSAEKVSLEASSSTIGDVFLRTESGPEFESDGDVRFVGVNIKGDLDCSGAKLRHRVQYALTADRATIKGDVFFRDGFEATGKISLWGAQIGSYLDFCSAKVGEIQCSNINLLGDLRWLGILNPFEASLDLTGARLRNLRDDKASWPKEGNAIFDGFVYDEVTLQEGLSQDTLRKSLEGGHEIAELQLDANERIDWLKRQPKDRSLEAQPWMFLAKHLESKGDRKGARHVIYAFRCLQAERRWLFVRLWKRGFAWLEENPIRILWSIVGTLLLGSCVFTWGGDKGAMTESVHFQPNSVYSFEDAKRPNPQHPDRPSIAGDQSKPVSPLYPRFQPFAYTLENAVPPIKLGMDVMWAPNASAEFRAAWFPRVDWLYFISTYGVLNFTRWALIVWGWVQATIFLAAVADRFKR